MEESKESNFDIPPADIAHYIKDPNLPRNYANGFVVGRTQTDMFLIPLLNSQPILLTSLSFNTAKRLLNVLQGQIAQIEKELGEIDSLTLKPNVAKKVQGKP